MSTPAFRSRWAEWNPGAPPHSPEELSRIEPAKPAEPGFEGFAGGIPVRSPGNHVSPGDGCTRCGSSLADPGGDLLCPGCFASRRGPGRVLTFDPRRRLRSIARLSGRPCGDCGAIDWYVSPRGDSVCRPCARARRAVTTDPGTNGVLGGGAA